MNYLNKTILKKYEKHWITLRDAGYISNLTKTEVEELLSVYVQEIDANYTVNKWCMSCVSEMINILYRVTKYDEPHKPIVNEDMIASDHIGDLPELIITKEIIKPEPKKRGRKKKK